MSFLPSIYDQLLWVEDNGKSCLADLRDGLLTRQTIDLDAEAKDVTRVQVEDFTDLPELEAVDRASDIDVMTSRQRSHWLANETPASTEAIMEGLTDQERHIIDGIRLTRTREERIAAQRRLRHAQSIPMSIRYDESSESVRPSFAQSVLRVIQAEAGQNRPMSRANFEEMTSRFTPRESEQDRQMDWQSFLDAYDTLHEAARPAANDNLNPEEARELHETRREESLPFALTQRQIANRVARIRAAREQPGQDLTSIERLNIPPPTWVSSPPTSARTRAGLTSYTLSARWDNTDPRGTTGHVISPDGKTM